MNQPTSNDEELTILYVVPASVKRIIALQTGMRCLRKKPQPESNLPIDKIESYDKLEGSSE